MPRKKKIQNTETAATSNVTVNVEKLDTKSFELNKKLLIAQENEKQYKEQLKTKTQEIEELKTKNILMNKELFEEIKITLGHYGNPEFYKLGTQGIIILNEKGETARNLLQKIKGD